MESIKSFIHKNEWSVFLPLAIITHYLFATNTVFFKGTQSCLLNDSWLLHNLAKSYVEYGEMQIAGKYTLFQLPLYPLLLSGFYKVFGIDPRYLLAFQIGLSVVFINCMVVFFRNILGNWRYFLGVTLCFDLHQLLYSACLVTEFWVMLFWALGLFFIYHYYKSSKTRFWVFSVLSFSVASNIKPLALFLPLFMLLLLFLMKLKIKARVQLAILTVILYILCLLPLMYRNYLITHKFPLVTTMSSYNMWYFNIAYARSILEGISVNEARVGQVEAMRVYLNSQGHQIAPIDDVISNDRHEHLRALGVDEFEYAEYANILSRQYLRENLFKYAICHMKSGLNIFKISNLSWAKLAFHHYDAISFAKMDFKTLSTWVSSKEYKKLWLFFLRVYEITFTFSFLAFALLGALIRLFQKNASLAYWSLWLIVIYVTFITGVNSWGRFRFLFMPFLIVLGIEGLRTMSQIIKQWRCDKRGQIT